MISLDFFSSLFKEGIFSSFDSVSNFIFCGESLFIFMLIVSLFCVYVFRVIIHGSSMFNKVLLGEYDLSFLIRVVHLVPLLALSFFLTLFFYLNSLNKIKNCGFLDKVFFK